MVESSSGRRRRNDSRRRIRAGVIVCTALVVAAASLPAAAYPRPGRTERVSVATDGSEGNSASGGSPSISADGRYVTFASLASNLVPGDTNDLWDIFVHDRETGTTERVSVASDGTEANDHSAGRSAISADGRYVAFASLASNLVPGDANRNVHVFVHDRDTGTTERVSVASDGTEGNGGSNEPAISADGRHVAFTSSATNLVPGDTNIWGDVFVHDRETGTTERVSVASDGTEGNDTSTEAAISADGRHVAFMSAASNLVPGDTNHEFDVFVHDRETGTTERVSVASDGTEGKLPSFVPAISADGRYVAFNSWGPNLVPGDTNHDIDVFVHDRETGATERVSVASDGTEGNSESHRPAISADGRHVAFRSFASNLVPSDTNSSWDVFVRDRGPLTGVGSLAAQRVGNELTVSGWATFSGVTLTSAEDPGDDGAVGGRELGAEIVGASVTYRHEEEDLLLRLRLASLPGPMAGGAPGVLYGWTLTVGEIPYEVRVLRAAGTATPPATPYFALYECAPSCAEVSQLSGGIGTSGAEVLVSVPLEVLEAVEGLALTDIEASAALGEAASGALVALDNVKLPDASIPIPRVQLGIAAPSTPQADVPFSAQADLVEGQFSGTLEVSSLSPGAHRVWGRACLGEACGTRAADVTL